MSDNNLTEKISETITNAFKKTKVFEKIGKIEIYIGSFILVSSIISLTSFYMHYSNTSKIKRLEDKIEGTENVLKHIKGAINEKKESQLSKTIKNNLLTYL